MNQKDRALTLLLTYTLFIFTCSLQLQAGTDGSYYGRVAQRLCIKQTIGMEFLI